MSKYLTPKNVGGTMAIAVCYRCQRKIYAGELRKDPNNQNYYCEECVDIYDPWRLPARRAEDISLPRPRPDTNISLTSPPSSIEYLIVAGGGAGGKGHVPPAGFNDGPVRGGSGGGGGVLLGTLAGITQWQQLSVVVGEGGTCQLGVDPTNGRNSQFAGIEAIGGGRGGSGASTMANARLVAAGSGGSGGGAVWASGTKPVTAIPPGNGVSGQGYSGGVGGSSITPGGGGGAGGPGGANVAGLGVTSSISGSSVEYSRGGLVGVTPTLYGQGGGGGTTSGSRLGTSGANGIVILRYPDTFNAASEVTGSPTVTLIGGYRIYTWTQVGSWSITF